MFLSVLPTVGSYRSIFSASFECRDLFVPKILEYLGDIFVKAEILMDDLASPRMFADPALKIILHSFKIRKGRFLHTKCSYLKYLIIKNEFQLIRSSSKNGLVQDG